MSRARIVAALAGIPTIHATPTPPTTPAQGQAWPEWVTTTFRTTQGACVADQTTWYVYVCLAPLDAQDDADTVRDQVASALAAAGVVVNTADPIALIVENQPTNPVPAIRYTARTRP